MAIEQSVRVGRERREIIRTLRSLIRDHTLPLWSSEGWDSSRGGFVERLDIVGKADYLSPRRVLVQARQVYCSPRPLNLAGIRAAVNLR